MSKIIGALALFLMFSATAALANTVQTVMTITTDAFPCPAMPVQIVLDDNGAATALLYKDINFNTQRRTLQQLRTPQVLISEAGHNAIYLSVERDFSPEKGGHADLRFLTNGITNTYRTFRILVDIGSTIVLRSDPDYALSGSDHNPYTGPFRRLFMKKNSVFGKPVGISRVIPSP